MSRYLLALDQGTTSSRAIVFDTSGRIQGLAQREFGQHYPHPGWVEHDPEEIWSTQFGTALEVIRAAGISPADLDAVGITNQRETTLVWDRITGEPVYPAIVWQDRRTADWCDRMKQSGYSPTVQEKTGLLLDPYFSAGKIVWILDNVPGVRARAEAGQLAFGTIDTWLAWKLTHGRSHITDATNASRTMLFNIQSGTWDDELLKFFRIPRSLLPEVRSSSEIHAPVALAELGNGDVPLAGIAGDQQSALIGQLCLAPGQTKTTYGTGCFMLQSTGESIRHSRHGLLTTVSCRMGGRNTYAVEGSVFIAGAVVQWLRDGLGLIRDSSEIESLASSVSDNGGVCFVPAFAGLGAPQWDPHARGMMVGLTRGTTRAHIARAALESIAFQVADLFDAMSADSGCTVRELRVDGGAARNDLLMQFQSDLLGIPLVRPAVTETTALGAAFLAGLAVGTWKSIDEIADCQQIDHRFEPNMPRSKVQNLREIWARGVERARNWDRSGE